ncbi:helix-turn-helix domain-containing protein [bacterium]|nr:helix-turn-helix domain-containing protein [bacterium]
MDIDKIIETSIKHDDYMIKCLQDKEKQRVWLETNLEEFVKDGNIDAFIRSLEYVIRARGRGAITALAKDLGMDRSNLSEILNRKKTPRIDTVFKLINGLGYDYNIQLKSA